MRLSLMLVASATSLEVYKSVERVLDLVYHDGDLDIRGMDTLDHLHFMGKKAADELIATLVPTSATRVLELGSSVGGPARYVANMTGASITAVEPRADVHAVAVELTTRISMGERVRHVRSSLLAPGDWLRERGPGGREYDRYDIVVSWFTLYKIAEADKALVMRHLASALRPGGSVWLLDLYHAGGGDNDFSVEERELLRHHLPPEDIGLLTRDEYTSALATAGFANVSFVDVTRRLRDRVEEKRDDFGATGECDVARAMATCPREYYEEWHGAEAVADHAAFYRVISSLLASGRPLGAALLRATRKMWHPERDDGWIGL
jgi:SAM-dependent methyltransferase